MTTRYIKVFFIAFLYYCYNHFITYIPVYGIRHFYLRTFLRFKIGKDTAIHMGCFFTGHKITIGNNCVINRGNYIDGRGGIIIGNNVSISPECYLLSLTHDVNNSQFSAVAKPVIIEDYVWMGVRAVILPGITLKKGSVVGAGSVVTRSVQQENSIVGGIPAKLIGERQIIDYNYQLNYFPLFDTDIVNTKKDN